MPKISKYPARTTPAGNSYLAVDADVSDEKYKAQFGVLNLLANRLKMHKQECDFIQGTATQLAPFTAIAVAVGTFAHLADEAEHPGIWRVSGGLNDGYNFGLGGVTSVLIGGGEVAEFVVRPKILSNSSQTFGFHDLVGSGNPTDQVAIRMGGTGIFGRCSNNGANSDTATTYTATVNTWYRLKTVVNAGATQVDFYVYNMSGTELWHDSVTTNIPTAAGRETGFGTIIYKTTTTVLDLCDLDWMAYYNYKALTR